MLAFVVAFSDRGLCRALRARQTMSSVNVFPRANFPLARECSYAPVAHRTAHSSLATISNLQFKKIKTNVFSPATQDAFIARGEKEENQDRFAEENGASQ